MRRGDAVPLFVWMVGVLILAGLGGGVGAFLWAAWTLTGLVMLVAGHPGASPEWLVAIAGALAVVGVLWWWATEPGSILQSAAGFLGPVFLGGALGAVVGLGAASGGLLC